MKRSQLSTSVAAIGLAMALLCLPPAYADHKPGHTPGGGGGGGETSSRFSVLELPIGRRPQALSEAGPDGAITVALEGAGPGGKNSAVYASVHRDSKTVLSWAFLPEPLYIDPETGEGIEGYGHSIPFDVNRFGDIVGQAWATLPETSGDFSPNRPILWTDDGDGYSYFLLPMLPGQHKGTATGTNNHGDIVGSINNGVDFATAVLWDAQTLSVVDLNTAYTAAAGWDLKYPSDINDAGLIVGHGSLDGASRGFVLDRATQTIWAIPLVAPATVNEARKINELGRVCGSMWNGEGNYWSPESPDYVRGYSWSGPATAPVVMPPITQATSHALGLNDNDATVGNSHAPYASPFSPDFVPTLWEFDSKGGIIATELQNAIPNKPSYQLDNASDINNDGWIAASSTKLHKGRYTTPGVLLIPNNTSDEE